MTSTFPTPRAFGARATSSGQRKGDLGKAAEGLVKSELHKLSTMSRYAYERLADARTGSKTEALADFLFMRNGIAVLLEVKEVAHDFRLPHHNFRTDQVARMRRFVMAGGVGRVLVRHMPLDQWRLIDIEFFLEREGGSWNLESFKLEKLADIANRQFRIEQ